MNVSMAAARTNVNPRERQPDSAKNWGMNRRDPIATTRRMGTYKCLNVNQKAPSHTPCWTKNQKGSGASPMMNRMSKKSRSPVFRAATSFFAYIPESHPLLPPPSAGESDTWAV
jgi:hypothetical protein